MRKSVYKKNEYVTPVCEFTRVELEEGMCATGSADIENPNKVNGRINGHKINTGFGGDFGDTTWDSPSSTD